MTKEQGGNTSLNMAALYDQENVIEPRIEHIVNHAADMEKATTDGQMIMSRGTTEADYDDLPEKAKGDGRDSAKPIDHALVQAQRPDVPKSNLTGGIWNQLFPKAILLSCMTFLILSASSRNLILEVRFVEKPRDKKWNDIHALNDPNWQPVKGDDDDIVLRPGTLTVACHLGEKSPKSDVQAIKYSEMKLKTKLTMYFSVDLTHGTLVILEMVQDSTVQTIKFKIPVRFQGIDKETTEQNAPSPTTDEISSGEQIVTDAHILNLAMLLAPDRWYHLHVPLKIAYCLAEGIKKKSSEPTEQYIHLLQTWKATSTRTRKELNEILNKIGAGGLVDKYLD